MTRITVCGLVFCAFLAVAGRRAFAEAQSPEKLTRDAPKERLVVDDMEDVSDWYNGSPEETTLSTNTEHVKAGKHSLAFANVVDHVKGQADYPVGWPRVGKQLRKSGPSDWSDYDFFECWIYADTSRSNLPGTPLGLGFSHAGQKTKSYFRLKEVEKDRWVKIVIPISKLIDAKDVQSFQFNISESDYKHGDRVDFLIDDVVLSRLVNPTIVALDVDRNILYSSDRRITALYSLMGRRRHPGLSVRFEIGPAGKPSVATVTAKPSPRGELLLPIANPLKPGTYQGKLSLLGKDDKVFDQRQIEFRVVQGPF